MISTHMDGLNTHIFSMDVMDFFKDMEGFSMVGSHMGLQQICGIIPLDRIYFLVGSWVNSSQ